MYRRYDLTKGAVRTVSIAVAAVLLGLVAAGGAQSYVRCSADRIGEQTIEGFFVDPKRQTRLFLITGPPDKGCILRHEDGPVSKQHLWNDAADLVDVCRDPVTGRDWALLYLAAGAYADLGFWSVDPVTGEVALEYEETWSVWGLEEEQVSEVVTAGGLCRARDRQKVQATLKRALSVLRADTRGNWEDRDEKRFQVALGDTVALPTRTIPAEKVRRWLSALESAHPPIATFEAPRYADNASRRSWTIIQVLGTRYFDAPGVVLALDRNTNEWRALYDVPSGGGKRLNFPMSDMMVHGDKLFARLCTDCSWWGYFGYFEIDLKTHRATRLETLPFPDENEERDRRILDLDAATRPQ